MWHWRGSRVWYVVACAILVLPGAAAVADEPGTHRPRAFFDPVVTISPGITREADVLFDHVRASSGQLTQSSIRLQYPVLPWLQFSLEAPVVLRDPDDESPTLAAGDIVLSGQAAVWAPRGWPAEIDLGFELGLPTGGSGIVGGSTALRPFVAAGIKLGPLDVLGNLSYLWVFTGPLEGDEVLQASLAVGYPLRRIAPFVEVTLLKPVRGSADLRPQVALLPGLEFFLPGNLSLSVGVQLPLGPARFFDQRVHGFFKWPF